MGSPEPKSPLTSHVVVFNLCYANHFLGFSCFCCWSRPRIPVCWYQPTDPTECGNICTTSSSRYVAVSGSPENCFGEESASRIVLSCPITGLHSEATRLTWNPDRGDPKIVPCMCTWPANGNASKSGRAKPRLKMKDAAKANKTLTGSPWICSPMHGVDLSQMAPQGPSCTHLDSANGVDVGCDLQNNDFVG